MLHSMVTENLFYTKSLMMRGNHYSKLLICLCITHLNRDDHSPPKIKTIRIVDNPFDDIVPRITAAEKRAQQRAREQAQREREDEVRRRGAKKCTMSIIASIFPSSQSRCSPGTRSC